MARKKLGELLVMAGAIDEFQLQSALGEQRKWGRHLGSTLVDMGLLDETTLVRVLSQQLNIAAIDLDKVEIEPEALRLMTYDLCASYDALPFRYEDKGKSLYVAMADPTNLEIFDRIRLQTRCNVRPFLAGPKAIETAIRRRYLGEVSPARQPGYRDPSGQLVHHREMVFAAPDSPLSSAEVDLDDMDLGEANLSAPSLPRATDDRDTLIQTLRRELKEIRALLTRDEMVLRKLMGLIVEKGLCSREELVARLHED